MSNLFANHTHCRGCESLGAYENELVCTNLVTWFQPVPENPPCYSEGDAKSRNIEAMSIRSQFRVVGGNAA